MARGGIVNRSKEPVFCAVIHLYSNESLLMRFLPTDLSDVILIESPRFGDSRGFFSEVYNRRTFEQANLALEFLQDNHAYSRDALTLRGLHFQVPPMAQAKLLRVTRGRVLDVVVDIRRGSPNYGRHTAVELSAENWRQILVPVGFAHGYCTLEPETEVLYKVSGYYSPDHEGGIAWNDPDLAIPWPVEEEQLRLSDKDRSWPKLADFESPFVYQPVP